MAKPTFEKVTDHIYRLEQTFFGGLLPVAVWLVRDKEGWVLVDAGAPGFEDALIEQVRAVTGGQGPRLMVLTHGHADHGAAAIRVLDEWRPLVAAGRDEIPYLVGASRYKRIPAKHPLYGLLQISGPALFGRSVHRPLDDGDCIGDMRVRVVPGHAPGMVALLHTADRALLCADVVYNIRNRLSDPAGPFTYDPALNRQSQARAAALDFDHLLPSHGPVRMQTGKQDLAAFVAAREKKKK